MSSLYSPNYKTYQKAKQANKQKNTVVTDKARLSELDSDIAENLKISDRKNKQTNKKV